MNRTSIEWTDFTANPLKFRDADGKTVWGCVHASPGCVNCYAETLAKRYGRGGPFNAPTMAKLTPFLDEKELRAMLTDKAAAGKRCFVGDMTDVFGEWVADDLLDRLFAVLVQRSEVTWQVLTKRAARIRDYFDGFSRRTGEPWPVPNVWLGVSCEDQQRANERIPHLLETTAAVRFVSAEPLIGPVELRPDWFKLDDISGVDYGSGLDWVIVGGESGPRSRYCDTSWIHSLLAQCRAAGVPCFMKQLGAKPTQGREGEEPIVFAVKGKGNDPIGWPTWMRVREFPAEVSS
jgi:protein gp37